MANSERMKVLIAVHNAKRRVSQIQIAKGLSPEQRHALSAAYWQIDAIEGRLIVDSIEEDISRLEIDSKALKQVCVDIKEAIADLEGVAKIVDQAATAVGALAQVISAAAPLVA